MTATRAFLAATALAVLWGCGSSDAPPRPKSDAAPDVGTKAVDAARAPDGPGSDGPGDDGPSGPDAMCGAPIPGCSPTTGGACDHVCQARCGCGQRCAIFNATPACVPPAQNPVAVGGACSPDFDDCTAGAVCLGEAAPACGNHCYRFCRTSADCPGGALCDLDVVVNNKTVAKACSSAPEKCDPTGEARCTSAGRPSPLFGCYVLSAQDPDSATCDCAGVKAAAAACMFEHECKPGLECIRVGTAGGTCRQVCHLGAAGSCPMGMTCAPLGTAGAPSTVFGYCAS
jgi:hypothetical protein